MLNHKVFTVYRHMVSSVDNPLLWERFRVRVHSLGKDLNLLPRGRGVKSRQLVTRSRLHAGVLKAASDNPHSPRISD